MTPTKSNLGFDFHLTRADLTEDLTVELIEAEAALFRGVIGDETYFLERPRKADIVLTRNHPDVFHENPKEFLPLWEHLGNNNRLHHQLLILLMTVKTMSTADLVSAGNFTCTKQLITYIPIIGTQIINAVCLMEELENHTEGTVH